MQPRLEINSLGSSQARKKYREKLIAYLQQHEEKLDKEAQATFAIPIHCEFWIVKILTYKKLFRMRLVLLEHLDAESAEHFLQLQKLLDAVGIEYHH